MDPVVRAGALDGFDDLVRTHGQDPQVLRRRHGLGGLRALEDPEQMVSLDAVAHLMEDASITCGCADFGLRLGAMQSPRMLGLLALVISGAEDVETALLDSTRYLFVHSPSYQLVLEPTSHGADWVTLRFDIAVDPDTPYRQLVDGCLASLLTLARALTGVPVTPRAVSLPHTPAAPPRTYRSVFGAPVSFEQPRAALHLDPRVLHTEIHAARPELRRTALAYITDRYPDPDASTATLVRNTIGSTLGATRGTKTEIAGLLGLHPRTLQRRLTTEGTTFEDIRDEVHRTTTRRLLTETALPLAQVAHALGFSEHSAMSRKVRHWFDTTPSQLRAVRRVGQQ